MNGGYIALSKYFKTPDFTFYDFGACLVIFIVVLILALTIKTKNSRKDYYRKYFLPGLIVKMLGGLAYALIYTYYYTYGGDTSGYWFFGTMFARILFEYPEYWWDVFTRNFDSSESFVVGVLESFRWAKSVKEFRVIQITSLIAPLGFMNFFASTMLLAAICYAGVWRLFLVFREKFPSAEKGLAIAVLFIPSVVFWGSGIMKDNIVFACTGLVLYGLNKLFKNGFFQIPNLLMIAFSVYLIFSIKPYIIFSLLPGVIIWRTLRYRDKIKNGFLRKLAVPIFLFLSFFGSLKALEYAANFNDQYSLENFLESAKIMQDWHYVEGANTSEQHGRGSSYSLGDYASTPAGVISIFPAAVNVTLFRPYPWEVTTSMQLISALESQLFLLFTLFVIYKMGLVRFFHTINNDSFLVLMFSFSLIFAFAVGFSAYNFGALARYKIPCIPFYLGMLAVIRQKAKEEKLAKIKTAYSKHLKSAIST